MLVTTQPCRVTYRTFWDRNSQDILDNSIQLLSIADLFFRRAKTWLKGSSAYG